MQLYVLQYNKVFGIMRKLNMAWPILSIEKQNGENKAMKKRKDQKME